MYLLLLFSWLVVFVDFLTLLVLQVFPLSIVLLFQVLELLLMFLIELLHLLVIHVVRWQFVPLRILLLLELLPLLVLSHVKLLKLLLVLLVKLQVDLLIALIIHHSIRTRSRRTIIKRAPVRIAIHVRIGIGIYGGIGVDVGSVPAEVSRPVSTRIVRVIRRARFVGRGLPCSVAIAGAVVRLYPAKSAGLRILHCHSRRNLHIHVLGLIVHRLQLA